MAANAQEEIFFIGEELGVGARAMSMGGAYVGVADDYSAMYWNPAGLGQLRRMEVNVGFSHNKFVNNAAFLGVNSKAEDTFTRLNSIGITIPVPTYQGSLVFGVGYNKVLDFDNRFKIYGDNDNWAYYQTWFNNTYFDFENEDGSFYFQETDINNNMFQEQSITEKGSENHFSFAGSMEVQENFFLGATVNFISGKNDYYMEFSETDKYELYNTVDTVFDTLYNEFNDIIVDTTMYYNNLDYWLFDQRVETKLSAVNLKIGALYRFGNTLRLGASIITPTTFKMTETFTENATEYLDNDEIITGDPITNKIEYKVKEPYAFHFGASLKLLNFLFSAGAEFKDWSNAQFLTDPSYGNESQMQINNRLEEDFKAVTKLRFGAEMYIPLIRAKVRAGYFTDPSPYRYTNIRPDKEYLTAGASLMLDKQVMVDLGYMIGKWKKETVDALTSNPDPSLYYTPVSENVTLQKIVGTLSIRF
ncbi:hypothetical protein EH223_17740 [candidate division KSB1 bacterium]|nr:MAG: hypothetical protein EH223_17740 [candidate division KSB1 bacterium]